MLWKTELPWQANIEPLWWESLQMQTRPLLARQADFSALITRPSRLWPTLELHSNILSHRQADQVLPPPHHLLSSLWWHYRIWRGPPQPASPGWRGEGATTGRVCLVCRVNLPEWQLLTVPADSAVVWRCVRRVTDCKQNGHHSCLSIYLHFCFDGNT